MALAACAATIVGAAHNFVSPYLPGTSTVGVDESALQEYVRHELQPEHGEVATHTPGARIHFRVDDALADLVDEECDRLGMDYSGYIRALLRRALGYSLDPAEWPTQGALEFEGVAS